MSTSGSFIATALKLTCEDLWPEVIQQIAATRMEVEVDFSALAALSAPHSTMRLVEDRQDVQLILDRADLTPQERDILVRALGGDESDQEIAAAYGFTRSRAGQIRDKALRKVQRAAQQPPSPMQS